MSNEKGKLLRGIVFIYVLCLLLRIAEYFILRTDETFLGEAFVHKLVGIAILFIAIKHYKYRISDIGFTTNRIGYALLSGVLFGLIVFIPAYLVEILIAAKQNQFESLGLFVSAYSVNGTIGNQTGVIFFLICIVGNVINVLMEEGVFRGLFQKILEKKYSFFLAAIICSSLFGVWHIIAPFRSYCDGTSSINGFIANAVMLFVTSGLVGLKFSMMTKVTGSLYMAMGDHFVNNTITNMLHVTTYTGVDDFQVLRITIAQTLSFIIVLVYYLKNHKKIKGRH